jgi:GMP synthase-like glutamine amidotransferase
MSTFGAKTILAIQNDETDPPHLVGRWLMELGFEIKILRAYGGESVPNAVPENIAGVIPLGGHMGALDDHIAPWLANERALLADAIARNIPVFAICLGTQLLAEATGGKVTRAKIVEIGAKEIFPSDAASSDSIFNFSGPLPVTQWHEDEVSVLPPGAVSLASSPACANQIYRVGENSYGVQFHPEADLGIVAKWEEHADNAFQTSGIASALPEYQSRVDEITATWKPFIQAWGMKVLSHTK